MAGRKSKYLGIANDPVAKRWLANLRRGSVVTAKVARRSLGLMCKMLDTAPGELLEKARRDPAGVQDSLEDLVADLETKGKAPGYIAALLKPIKSLLKYHGVVLPRQIKITNAGATPTVEDEQVPSQEELSRIFRASLPKVRVAEALLTFADLRPETLGNHDGTDGLRLSDLPELRISGGEVTFEKIPTMIRVRSTLSKARHKYFTFLSSEGCTYLKEYLEERMRSGERLKPETPLIGHDRPKAAVKPFVHTGKITDSIRECMRAAGVYKRPYVLRAYAETQLIIAESKGRISHPYLQFIAGHKGDIEARYSTNKGRLPPDMIEDMREAYKRCEPFLSTVTQPLEQASVVKEAKLEAIKTVAKNLFGVDLVEVKFAQERELGHELTRDEEIKLYEKEVERRREQADDLMNRLMRDPEVQELVKRKLRELRIVA
jgi:hypothetical protein